MLKVTITFNDEFASATGIAECSTTSMSTTAGVRHILDTIQSEWPSVRSSVTGTYTTEA